MSSAIPWPVPEPVLPTGVHPALAAVARAAARAYGDARRRHTRAELGAETAMGADGTPTMLVDELVEEAVAEAARQAGTNLLSEEIGFVDIGSAVTLVVDPVDGSANAASGVPLSCLAAAVSMDGTATEALTCWFDTGRTWHAVAGRPTPYRTSGRTRLDGATVDVLRPRPRAREAWHRLTDRAGRIRILSSTCLEGALVAEGAIDAFADAGGDVHRIMDLVAAMVTVPAAGGAVVDAFGRPLEIDPDLTRRWSGVIAATPELAEEVAQAVRG
ncbi:inositol monophosphatase family protein [Marinitenerispora sediminis]|uniref:Inositol monophosphatase n=1 Tax=Marinitenerispora sediminis TaxID=1931232 RepID=A0A368SYR6_9ACTN|nr:inositol monophosphatase family protein [Marinitenerispora sediminis]RCV48199.1 inositol monophosphatase [Marinitenerispora sediminis]RCV49767.1 inositol monophosphatase [Marinitenerispora sediminis]RCV55873.1 inositol monophosphatase [Marinitenerispora sediminis]